MKPVMNVGQALDDEHPLPALEAPEPVPDNAQNPTGEGGANQGRDQYRHHEHADDAGAHFGGKPVGEIKNDPGKEAGFGNTEYEFAMHTKLVSSQINAWPIDRMPQVIMMRAIQMRAPVFSRIRLLGTSKRK